MRRAEAANATLAARVPAVFGRYAGEPCCSDPPVGITDLRSALKLPAIVYRGRLGTFRYGGT